MAKLEELRPGSIVRGLIPHQDVEIISTKWYGNTAIDITYRDGSGNLGNQIAYRDDEGLFEVLSEGERWSFDGDADAFRLLSEAYRINLAYLFDPYLAVNTSSIEPLPHQITAVYQEMLPRQPLRYVLADDPGAGKTIMTGLLLKELMIRGDVKRCLVVAPGNLVEQWQDELLSKFGIKFDIITNDAIESAASGNVFGEVNLAIARLDKLARNEEIQTRLKATEWDLIVVDEAHKMAASSFGGEVRYTKRWHLGRLLSDTARHFLLLTATPHNGKNEDFQLFLSLIDPDRFEGVRRSSYQSVDISDLMRRLVKEDLLKFDGKPLFPERLSYTVNYTLSDKEAELYAAVTEYVREEFNRADKLSGERRNTIGFALTILQRRLASSPEAIYQSLKRRRERLEHRLKEEELNKRAFDYRLISDDDLDDYEESPDAEVEDLEEELLNQSSAAQNIEELEQEIKTLTHLEELANHLRRSGKDQKWSELSRLLQDDNAMKDAYGNRHKLIIFTEHLDTLKYLTDKVGSLTGRPESVVNIYGGMVRDERRKIEQLFKQDKDTTILIATDAAGEGINLQRAHLMINYDLPWNPNRLEQRFGRIHRIGQTEVCHLWNLVASETREGLVFQRLFEKLETEREALGGKVFDVLGKLKFDDKPLRDLLVEAVRYGNQPEIREKLNTIIDDAVNKERLLELLEERALTHNAFDIQSVLKIKEQMDLLEARKLQPHFIQLFFVDAFTQMGGLIKKREPNRFEITKVPSNIRDHDAKIGIGRSVLKQYERVTFDKAFLNIPGKPTADLICPGHPLLDNLISLILEHKSHVLKQGAILVDDSFRLEEPRLLIYLESSIQDGKIITNQRRRIISKQVNFIEINDEGKAFNAGHAPYIDYRALLPEEQEKADEIKASLNIVKNAEEIALNYAIEELLPTHLAEVKNPRLAHIEKIERAVEIRLTHEINYWDQRANELKLNEDAGKKKMRISSIYAKGRADELADRMKKRLADLQLEKNISPLPPVLIGAALVIPSFLLSDEMKKQESLFGQDRKIIERIAMHSIIAIESEMGNNPIDVSANNCGYDILSKVPDQGLSKFIEVKGRTKGSSTITVTRNEILTSLNKPQQFILAIVEVDGNTVEVTYLAKPFLTNPDDAASSINFDIMKLKENSQILFTQQRGVPTWQKRS